ncbi:MAG: GTP-binding protein [Oscillospiraceae bacterium]
MKVINLGILAHVDAGKTTAVEQLLYRTGTVRALGSVDKGSAHTDWLVVERERGISVRSASATLRYRNLQINLIDTPGHMDFTGEVERALSVLDAAVLVVSGAEGIQSQTERFWKAIRALRLPTILLVNKIDRAGCDPEQLLADLKKEFSPAIIPLNRAENAGLPGFAIAPRDFSEEDLLELCELDDGLAARYLEGEAVSQEEIASILRERTAKCEAFPLLYSAMAQGIGAEELLEAIETYLPQTELRPEGELSGVVYKIEHDKAMGKVAHIRLYGGTLHNRDEVPLRRPGMEPFSEKATQIRRVSGGRGEDMGQLAGGDIGAVFGLSSARTGDIVGKLEEGRSRLAQNIAQPLFSVQVFAGEGQESKLLEAISQLSDEDPLLDYQWDREERELVIRIMGKVQLEILEYLLRERYGLAATFSQPTVIYKETPVKQGVGIEVYTMPKPCWAVVELQIDPLPRGSGYRYKSVIKDSILPYRYQNHVEVTVPETLRQGLMGWEVIDLEVTLIGGQHHHVHTHPMDFFLATPIAVMQALVSSGTQLLEPVQKLRISAPEEFSGKLIGDVLGMRGDFDSPVISGGKVELEALVPVAASMDYSVRFASLTGGKGTIRSEFSGYRECPEELGASTRRRGVNPLDRAKWILHKRAALNG